MSTRPFPAESAREALEKVLASTAFGGAARSSRLLRFLVERTIAGQADQLKEYTIGTEALGRNESFDPRIDPIARVEVSRLRTRLEQYYATEGRTDPIAIVLPKGTYVPVFEHRKPAAESESFDPIRPLSRWQARQALLWFALGATAACASVLLLWRPWRMGRETEKPLIQFDVLLAPGGFVDSNVGGDIAISPDGTSVAFAGYSAKGIPHLAIRHLQTREAMELPGTVGAREPFFSPDGQWLAFWASGKLKKIAVSGGAPIDLCDATDLLGGSWGDDGNIVAVLDSTGRLFRIPSSGGLPLPIIDLTRDSLAPRWPQVLPGAKAVLFTSVGASSGAVYIPYRSIEILDFRTGKRTALVREATYGRYLPSGHLIYVNQGSLFGVSFDLGHTEVRGSPAAILHDISFSSIFGFAQFDVSRSGVLVYRRAAGGGRFTIQWLARDGALAPLLDSPAPYQWPRISPDGQKLAYVLPDGIWLSEQQPHRSMPLIPGNGIQDPVWSPDGRYIVGGGIGMWWARAEGPAKPRPLTQSNNTQVPWSFTPDGGRLAFYEMSPSTAFDIWTVPVQSGNGELRAGKAEPFVQTPFFEVYPAFSPDGRWIAYSSHKSGLWEVYVRPFPDGGGDVQVSTGGGRVPRWPAKGHEIFYATDDHRIMAVPYTIQGSSFKAGTARIWSDRRLADTGVFPNFDVNPNGTRVAAILPAVSPQESQPGEATFLINFFDELKRRLP